LTQSYVLDSGEDGVILSGGTRTTLVPGSHVVEDSEITNNARFARTYHPAVQLEGVGHTVRNNLIHDTSHSAIMFTGNDHLIELNEIRNVLSATGDAGAIYTGRDWGARGNVIANNFIHNISSIFSSDAVYGIYLDDAVSGIEVRGNVVYRVAGNAIVKAAVAVTTSSPTMCWRATARHSTPMHGLTNGGRTRQRIGSMGRCSTVSKHLTIRLSLGLAAIRRQRRFPTAGLWSPATMATPGCTRKELSLP
jgi:hypothetical protein